MFWSKEKNSSYFFFLMPSFLFLPSLHFNLVTFEQRAENITLDYQMQVLFTKLEIKKKDLQMN